MLFTDTGTAKLSSLAIVMRGINSIIKIIFFITTKLKVNLTDFILLCSQLLTLQCLYKLQ